MNNTLEGIYIKLDDTEEQISELKDRIVEITESEYLLYRSPRRRKKREG